MSSTEISASGSEGKPGAGFSHQPARPPSASRSVQGDAGNADDEDGFHGRLSGVEGVGVGVLLHIQLIFLCPGCGGIGIENAQVLGDEHVIMR